MYLGQHAGVRLADYLTRMDAEGLVALDAAGAEARIRHPEAVLSKLLAPTLEMLSPLETAALRYAALLPPDSIPPVWLRSLVSDQFPEAAEAPAPGHPDTWEDALQRLDGLRLLIRPADAALCRMHRLVQQVVAAADAAREERQTAVVSLARSRCEFLDTGWLQWENRWEIEPLRALAEHLMEMGVDGGTWIANSVALRLDGLARYTEAEPLMRRALAIDEKSYGPDHPTVANYLNNLAELLRATNRLSEAELLCRRALEIDEASYGPDHPEVALPLNNLAGLLYVTNRLSEAEPLCRRVLDIVLKFTRATGYPHPHLWDAANSYGGLLVAMGVSLDEAVERVRKLFGDSGADIGTDGQETPPMSPKLRALLEKLTQNPLEMQETVEQLQRDDVALYLEFMQWTRSQRKETGE